MGILHMYIECDLRFTELRKTLERHHALTGRGGTLVYIPDSIDEVPVALINGMRLTWSGSAFEEDGIQGSITNAFHLRYHPTNDQIASRSRKREKAQSNWHWVYLRHIEAEGWKHVEEDAVPQGLAWSETDSDGNQHAIDDSNTPSGGAYVRRQEPMQTQESQ